MTWVTRVWFSSIIFPTRFPSLCCRRATASLALILLLGWFQLSARNVLRRSSVPSQNQWAEQHISSALPHLCLIFEIPGDYSELAFQKEKNRSKTKQNKKVQTRQRQSVDSLWDEAVRFADKIVFAEVAQMPDGHGVLGSAGGGRRLEHEAAAAAAAFPCCQRCFSPLFGWSRWCQEALEKQVEMREQDAAGAAEANKTSLFSLEVQEVRRGGKQGSVFPQTSADTLRFSVTEFKSFHFKLFQVECWWAQIRPMSVQHFFPFEVKGEPV